jgi:GT2 family glycosyltransferase
LLYEPRKGVAVARNCGIRGAEGDLLAFTDDDCRLDPDYVVDLLAHSQSDKVPTLRGGRVELGDPLDLPMTIKTDNEAADYAHPMHPAGFIHGANMTMPRTVLDSLGLFDERFGAGTKFPGEDCDYIIRAHAAGIRVQNVPDMVVFHFHGRRDKGSAQRLFAGYMRANGALYAKHLWSSPLLIRHLWWDIKQWYRELRGSEEKFLSEVDIGHRQIVVGNVIGMLHFTAIQIRAYILNFFGSKG